MKKEVTYLFGTGFKDLDPVISITKEKEFLLL
jgi:hypothetical protein